MWNSRVPSLTPTKRIPSDARSVAWRYRLPTGFVASSGEAGIGANSGSGSGGDRQSSLPSAV